MRTLIIVLLCLTSIIAVPTTREEYGIPKHKITDKQTLQRTKDVLRLLKYVNQPSYFKDFVETANSFSFENSADLYANEKAFKQFLYYYHKGLLPRGEIFSVFYEEHLRQAIALFRVLYYAKNYESFYKTAVWARQHVNEGLFLYSFSVALKHRNDTNEIILPPIYEIYPYYFVNSEAIYEAQKYKQLHYGQQQQQDVYTVYANYTGEYFNVDPEQSLDYFLEDVGLNSFYYYYNLYYPFWFGGEEFNFKNERRGELYYFVHQQLLARYYLERLSNSEGNIPVFDYEYPIETGYYPSLHYPNGIAFPSRPSNVYLRNNYYYYEQKNSLDKFRYSYYIVQDLERRIRDAIDTGFIITEKGDKVNIFTPEGFNVLGNLIESNPDSPNTRLYGYLQVFVRQLLGHNQLPLDKYHVVPSALQHFETSLRDPIYWQFYKRIVFYFQKYKYYLPKYTQNELYFPGVKIEDAHVDPLVTFFDSFDFDITSSIYVNPQEFESDAFQVRARQQRLNHKPFSYSIDVSSDKQQQAVVRVFLGPKYDEYHRPIDINENRLNFIELDQFVYELKSGKNNIVRNSYQFAFAGDRTTYKHLYQNVESALKGQEEFEADFTEFFFGFPRRLILPKGKRGGQIFQFYFIVTPFKGPVPQNSVYQGGILKVGSGNLYVDSLPLGYPFDRVIDETVFFSVPNSYFKDVVITHKSGTGINVSTQFENEE